MVAGKPGYKFLEKSQKNSNMSDIEFENLCQKIYLLGDTLGVIFFWFDNLLALKTSKQNIIIDKNILSTYFWNGKHENECLLKI